MANNQELQKVLVDTESNTSSPRRQSQRRLQTMETNDDMVDDSQIDSDDSIHTRNTRNTRPSRRSTRRSTRQHFNYEEEDHSNHNGHASKSNGHSNHNGHSHTNGHSTLPYDETDGLRRSSRIRGKQSQNTSVAAALQDDDEDENGKKRPGDSDYDIKQFEEDLQV